MKRTSWRYILPEPFISMKRNPLMSLAAILTVVIALYLCGIFWLLVVNIDANATKMESAVEIKVFIEDEITQEQMDQLSSDVKALDGVASVRYVSRAEGLASMSSKFGSSEEIVEAIKTNPLPNSYTVKADTPEQVPTIAAAVEQMDHVEAVRYGQGSVENLFLFMNWLRIMGVAIMVLLGVSAIVLISMNIRLTVSARREEIQVMKYVGATNSFIIWPFILEGIVLGLLGGGIAVGLVLWSYHAILGYLSSSLQFLTFVSFSDIAGMIILTMLVIGVVLGAIGSAIAVRKHVRV